MPILKPNKSLTQPSSYRPISLLCTLCKLLEKLICTRIKSHLPISHNTVSRSLLHHLAHKHNSTYPRWFQPKSFPNRTLLAMMDINKAFDTIPKHILQQNVLNTTLHTNDKKWLTNFLSDRTSQTRYKNTKSITLPLYNGLPQGTLLSADLFNLSTLDPPITTTAI